MLFNNRTIYFIRPSYITNYRTQLNSMQKLWFDITMTAFHQKEQLLLIVLGVAGTGKSHTISAISHALPPNTVIRCAFTAKAAFNIRGGTLHSIFKLQVENGRLKFQPLGPKAVAKLQNYFKTIKIIIIDEFSMVSNDILGKIDCRLREATGNDQQLFGGLSVILVGDLAQLPPVLATPVYRISSKDYAPEGFAAYRSFNKVIKLTKLCRQQVELGDVDQQTFVDLLNDLRNGKFTMDQWNFLLKRSPANIENFTEKFQNAIRLYSTNADVNKQNIRKLKELKNKVTLLNGVNQPLSGKCKNSDKFRWLQNELYVSLECEISLTYNMSTPNGLTNRAPGKIVDIVYLDHQTPNKDLPEFIVVKIPQYSGPQFFTPEDQSRNKGYIS